jgi:hypothetical protein
MLFQKSIELWGREEDLRSGVLKLQKGQHVTCGGDKGRFVSVSAVSIWIAHSEDDFKAIVRRARELAPLKMTPTALGHFGARRCWPDPIEKAEFKARAKTSALDELLEISAMLSR